MSMINTNPTNEQIRIASQIETISGKGSRLEVLTPVVDTKYRTRIIRGQTYYEHPNGVYQLDKPKPYRYHDPTPWMQRIHCAIVHYPDTWFAEYNLKAPPEIEALFYKDWDVLIDGLRKVGFTFRTHEYQ